MVEMLQIGAFGGVMFFFLAGFHWASLTPGQCPECDRRCAIIAAPSAIVATTCIAGLLMR